MFTRQILISRRIQLIGAVGLFVCLLPCRSLYADPNNKAPESSLSVHGGDFAKQLLAKATELSAAVGQEVRHDLEEAANGRLQRLSGKEVGQTRLKIILLQRMGAQLQMLGEPAGVDFVLRASEAGPQMHERVTVPWGGLPTSQNFLTGVRLQLKKTEPARVKLAQKLATMIEAKQWEQAETELYALLDILTTVDGFLTQPENQALYLPFAQVRSPIDQAMSEMRSEKGRELLTQSLAEQTPNFASQLAAMNAAVTEVATSGQANWEGTPLPGPQLVEKFADRWRAVHVGAVRARGIEWALRYRTIVGGYSGSSVSNPSNPSAAGDKLAADYRNFCLAMAKVLSDLIQQDAKRATPDAIPQLHSAYLKALAPLVRQQNDPQFANQLELALRQLSGKAPAYDAEVAAYELGTTELLRWRARAAKALSTSQLVDYQPLEKRLFDNFKSDTDYRGLYPAQQSEANPPTLLASAPVVMPQGSARVAGQQVVAWDVLRIAPQSKTGVARYRSRAYANVPAGLDVAGELEALKFDLLVSEQAPPLTLASTVAVDTAERGDFTAVGGDVIGNHLEGVITRFAGLPAAAHVLLPLGSLPTEDLTRMSLNQMLMRFDVQPRWVQHDHFFVELTSPAAE